LLYNYFNLSYPQIQYLMPNLYPGRKPLSRSGRRGLCLLVGLIFPIFIFAQPHIGSVSPLSGNVGSTVTITGSNFSATASANLVRFGPVQAPVTSATATTLTVTVPAGTANLPVTVTTAGLTGYFYVPFNTTFTDPGQFAPSAFSTRTDLALGAHNGPQSVAAMDIDGDGKQDLVIADGDSNKIDIYRNTSTPGSLAFTLAYKYYLSTGFYPVGVALGDLDGDGKPEIIVTNAASSYLGLFQNTSTAGSISFSNEIDLPQGSYGVNAVIGDLNGDGKPEIAVTNLADNTIGVYPNTSTVGHLSFGTTILLSTGSITLPFQPVIADVDGDGMPDLAVSNQLTGTISIFRNTGIAGGVLSFSTNTDFTVGNFPLGLFAGDLDGDGKPDLAVANYSDNTISLLLNTSSMGSVSFVKGADIPVGNNPQSITIADLDGDGKPDIAVSDLADDSVDVLRNTSIPGALTLASSVGYATNAAPQFLIAGDMDGDGMPDLVTVDNTADMVSILRNISSSSPAPSITSFTPKAGVTGTIVTIVGLNLGSATAVSFGGTAASAFTPVSADTITATVAGGASGAVSVVTPDGTASLNGFTYGLPQPAITGFQPASGTTGSTILIKGSALTGVTSVSFGGVTATSFTVQTDSTITAVVASGATGPIALTAPGGNAASSTSFTYTTPQTLALYSFSPASASTGTIIYVRGTGLSASPTVSFGGTGASNVTVLSDTLIAATVGSGTSGEVVVTTTSGTDSLPGFTYIPSAPPPPTNIQLTAFSPATGTLGTRVTISGSHLSGATSVSFGGVSAQSFTVNSDNQIVATVGNGATGQVKVTSPTSADSLPNFVFQYDTTRQSPPAVFKLLSFTGVLNSNKPQLQWTTVNDGGVSYYAIERGIDSTQFSIIATVRSVATGNTSHTYTYTDNKPLEGINYYRIKIQDTTTAYAYTPSVALQPLDMAMPVYPNPVKYGFFLVDLPVTALPSVIRLADPLGAIRQVIPVAAGVPQVRIDVTGWLPGVYRLSWTNGVQSAYQTILILRK
jgi:VCBS repeat protein/IPT/TIG domain-containing protein